MSTVDVLSWEKKKVSTLTLPEDVFEVPVKEELLHLAVKWQLAKRRQGTHMTKTKGLVSGGGKKPFKQKGTGNARQGSSRSPLMPGGGTTFGPEPRSYEFSLPKKVRRLMLSMALSHLNKEGRLFVVDKVHSDAGKTKAYAANFKSFGIDKCLVIDGEVHDQTKRAIKNLQSYKYVPVIGANVFDILKYDSVILDKNAVDMLVSRCRREGVQ